MNCKAIADPLASQPIHCLRPVLSQTKQHAQSDSTASSLRTIGLKNIVNSALAWCVSAPRLQHHTSNPTSRSTSQTLYCMRVCICVSYLPPIYNVECMTIDSDKHIAPLSGYIGPKQTSQTGTTRNRDRVGKHVDACASIPWYCYRTGSERCGLVWRSGDAVDSTPARYRDLCLSAMR